MNHNHRDFYSPKRSGLRARIARLIIFSIWISTAQTFSQSPLELMVPQFSLHEVRGYIQPLAEMFSANMHAGLYHGAAIPRQGFHLQIELVAMASLIGSQHRAYDAPLPAGFVPESGSSRTATVFGGKGTVFRDVNSGLEYRGSDGLFGGDIFPLFAPQLRIGSVLGTELLVRYMQTPQLSSRTVIPTKSVLWGIGVRHSISQYISNAQVDMAAGFFVSRFTLGTLMRFSSTAYSIHFSKSLSLVTLYCGLGYERGTLHLQYRHRTEPSALVDVRIEPTNQFRVTTGFMIDLQAVQLFADANFGNVHHYAAGLGFGL
ncbi:MAG TPA: DUF6588 family protein [Bacteroidota bacterium]|nr:DUF6588 family protein [Bacteroidota bacterium]